MNMSIILSVVVPCLLINNTHADIPTPIDLRFIETALLHVSTLKVNEPCFKQVMETVLMYHRCNTDSTTTIVGLNCTMYSWITKIMDAQGFRDPAETSLGNRYQLGSYQECITIVAKLETSRYKGMYCTAGFTEVLKYSDPPLINVTRGFCMPNTCSDLQVSTVLTFANGVNRILQHKKQTKDTELDHMLAKIIPQLARSRPMNVFANLSIRNASFTTSAFVDYLISINPFDVECHRPLKLLEDTGALIMICILLFLGCLVMLGTLCDYVVSFETTQDTKVNDTMKNANTKRDSKTKLIIVRCVTSFSVTHNLKAIFTKHQRQTELQCIHGIRVVSLSWILLGHVYIQAKSVADNEMSLMPNGRSFLFQVVERTSVAVDTFFLISGIMLGYIWFTQTGACQGVNLRSATYWLSYIVHRFIRLTPAYALVVGINAWLARYISDGPFWEQKGFDLNCNKYWYRNILYIQNMFQLDEICFKSSWYLANDMQFYLIAPVFLLTMRRWPVVGATLAVIVSGSSMIIRAIFYNDHYSEQPVKLRDMDSKPWMRIGAHLVGLCFGYMLANYVHVLKTLELKKIYIAIASLVISYACALILCLLIEAPAIGLEKSLLRHDTTVVQKADEVNEE